MSNVLRGHFGSPGTSFAVDSVKVVRLGVNLTARFGLLPRCSGTTLLCCLNLAAFQLRLVLFRKNFSVDFHTKVFGVKLLQRDALVAPPRGLHSS